MATAIEVEHLTKTFPGKVAVNDISFSIEQGQVVGFLGPNGAGKTTTIRILTCFTPATHGRARVMDFDVFDQSIEVRKRIGYLPEATPVYPEMRVEEYLSYRARLKGVPRSDTKKFVERAMERTQIYDVRRQIIGQLSKGYRQRVGFADALVAAPPILILDEPTIGLDPNQIRQTRSLIRELGEDHTVFLSTHILPEVEQVCDRVVIIHKGSISGEGTPADLRERFSQGVRLRLEVRGQSPETIQSDVESIEGITRVELLSSEIDGEPQTSAGPYRSQEDRDPEEYRDAVSKFAVLADADAEIREDIFFAATEGEWVIRELATEAMSLEEVFAHVTSEEDEEDEEYEEDEGEEASDDADSDDTSSDDEASDDTSSDDEASDDTSSDDEASDDDDTRDQREE